MAEGKDLNFVSLEYYILAILNVIFQQRRCKFLVFPYLECNEHHSPLLPHCSPWLLDIYIWYLLFFKVGLIISFVLVVISGSYNWWVLASLYGLGISLAMLLRSRQTCKQALQMSTRCSKHASTACLLLFVHLDPSMEFSSPKVTKLQGHV